MGRLRFKIHPLFFLLGAALFLLGQGFMFVSYTITVIIHEFGHAAVAERYGYVLDDLKLMPYGAVLSGKIQGISAKEEIFIAAAGPITNLITAILFTAVFWLAPQSYPIIIVFVISNMVTALFNFLPVFPLDGGRVLLAILSSKKSYKTAFKTIRIIGFIISISMIILFVVSIFKGFNISLIILGIFILVSAYSGAESDGYVNLYNRTYRSTNIKKGMTVKEIAVQYNMTLLELSKMLSAGYYYRFCVLDAKLQKVTVITESDLESFLDKHSTQTTIKEILKL